MLSTTPDIGIKADRWAAPVLPDLAPFAGDLESLVEHLNAALREYREKFIETRLPLETYQVAKYERYLRGGLEIIRANHKGRLIHLPLDLPDSMRADFQDLLCADHEATVNLDRLLEIQ